jgi:hypothetical protein
MNDWIEDVQKKELEKWKEDMTIKMLVMLSGKIIPKDRSFVKETAIDNFDASRPTCRNIRLNHCCY